VRVAIVAEYYPRAEDPVLGVWAHRQALAARDAGADVRVLVLHRPVPPRAALRDPRAWRPALRQPLRAELDGIPVRYVPFLAPPRWRSYGGWGAWAAPPLALALRRLRARWRFDLVHAHYAAPAGDAVRRARPGCPVVVSAHGGDVLSVAHTSAAGGRAVRRALHSARLVLANSAGTADRCRALGARATRVVRLGTDVPAAPTHHDGPPTLTTVGHLVARKRHADVLRAMWLLRDSHPDLRWDVVGDGPERAGIERLAAELGLADRVDLRGALPPSDAAAAARSGTVFVLPSVDEAFGVAYIEAMAGGIPAVGCRGEAGPEEIAAAGGGIRLVPAGEPEALAAELRTLLDERRWRRELGEAARENVLAHFTWEACGRATVAAYEQVLRR
jgi:teichuronic acid biosynthesis glycosyltransferase TuaC